MRRFNNKHTRGKTSRFLRYARAGFDAARTHDQNYRHWSGADGLSADGEASPHVRATLRNRSRYEVANNSYAKGIVLTLANDTIGTGPRLQMLTENEPFNRDIEKEFMMWSSAVNLPEKLRTMRIARCQDGETFGILGHNPRIWHDVKMDIKLIEADQVTSALGLTFDEREVDGIVFDNFGNPQSYRVMKNHPGGINFTYTDDFIDVPASAMIHNFRKDRPGLHRGVPEMTPALGLFAQLRRFSQATLNAAEAAADFAGILYTDAPPDGEADEVRPLDSFQLEKNMLLAMPGGWKMGQLDPKHPASTYAEYVDKIIDEIVRCILMPSNLGRGNSDKSSFASGRLDIQSYLRMLRVDQSFIATVIMDKILGEWLREYSLLNPSFGVTARYPLPQHFWFWDASHYHIDAYKEARAQEISLKTHATTLAAVYANQGKDWAGEILQRSREKQLMQKLGLTDQDVTPLQNNHDEKEEDIDMDDNE